MENAIDRTEVELAAMKKRHRLAAAEARKIFDLAEVERQEKAAEIISLAEEAIGWLKAGA